MTKKFNLFKPLICFLLGATSTFSLEPYAIYPLIFCFSIGVYIVLQSEKRIHTFFNGWSFSFGWFFFGLYWIGSAFFVKSAVFHFLMPFAIIFLPGVLSLVWAAAFLLTNEVTKINGIRYVWFVVVFPCFEFFRGYYLEFPWLMPGTFFASNKYLLQSFSFVGSYSMNIVLIIIVIIPIVFFCFQKIQSKLTIFLIFPLILMFFCGYKRYENIIINHNKDYVITLVQPNISQKDKWKTSLISSHYKVLQDLTNKKNDLGSYNFRLIVWPETAFVGVYPRDKEQLLNIKKFFLNDNSNDYLFTGVINLKEKDYYNSAILINSKNKVQNVYNKNFLVPFGEYIPLKKMLPKLTFLSSKIDFKSGSKNQNFSITNKFNFLPLICYEIIFHKYILEELNDKIRLIINITNDAWFGDTIGPYQHLQFAKIRSVEFGIPVVRVANTGISGFFDPYGNMISEIKLNKRGVVSNNVMPKLESTLFKLWGNKIFILMLIYVLLLFTYIYSTKRSKN